MNKAHLETDESLPDGDRLEIANTELHSFLAFAKTYTDATFWADPDISLTMAMASAFFSPNARWFYSLSSTPSPEQQALRVMTTVIDPTGAATRIVSAKTIYADPSRRTTKEVASHIKSQVARCFWTGLPIDDNTWDTDFTVDKLFQIDGLDDIQNLVVASRTASSLMSSKHRTYTATEQPLVLNARSPEEVTYPDYLEYGVYGISKWIGTNELASNRTTRVMDSSHLSVNLNGSRVCPRTSSRTRIAFAYLFLRDKYPALAGELDKHLSFNTASKWLTGDVTGGDICWQFVTFYLQGDIVPWFQVETERRQRIINASWNVHDFYSLGESKTPFRIKDDQQMAQKTATVLTCHDAKIYSIQSTNPVRTSIVISSQPMSEECTAAIERFNKEQATRKAREQQQQQQQQPRPPKLISSND